MDVKELKSRGKKHAKNKNRYRDQSKVVKQASENDSEDESVELTSNWFRYERKEKETGTNLSTNYKFLADAPISKGDHFQFKRDKTILENDTKSLDNDLFSLNLNMLSYSLYSIPFDTRCGLDPSCFSKSQGKGMRKKAEDGFVRYQQYLEGQTNLQGNKIEVVTTESDEDSLDDQEIEIVPEMSTVDQQEVVQEKCKADEKLVDSKKDLEEWLDNILDD